MAEDILPERLVLPTRDELIRRYERDYTIRSPGARVGDGTLARIDAALLADMVMPLYAEADRMSAVVEEDRMTDDQLVIEAKRIGLDPPNFLPETGASGFVIARASSSGGTIYAGDEIRDPQTQIRFTCAATALYADGAFVPVTAVDTGPNTNIAAGTVLKWTSPRPGIAPEASVSEQYDGSGLSGGRLKETSAEFANRIRDRKRNPVASGNCAAYCDAIQKVAAVPVQKAFAIPCVNGPGTVALMFTLRPSMPGGSRIPNSAQIAQVTQALAGKFPEDDSAFVCTLVAEPTTMVLALEWTKSSVGWLDAVTWPPGDETDQPEVTAVNSFIGITVEVANTSFTDPVVGQTIAFWNASTQKFVRKRIATVIASTVGPNRVWDLTIDLMNGSSDLDFIPAVGAKPSPWSDLLDTLTKPILEYFDGLGPGEQVATFDAGLRQRRFPESPESWPNEITTRAIEVLLRSRSIKSIELITPALPHGTPLGSAMVSSKLLTLGDLAVYPR